MNELELIVKDTKCTLEDASNYLSARTMFFRSVVSSNEKLEQYLEAYILASRKLYPKVIKLSPEGLFINNYPVYRTGEQ